MKNMKEILLGLLAGVTLVSVGYGGYGYYWRKVVTDRVDAMLNDPDSAKYAGVMYHPSTKAGCGYVNARNRMGGYVGQTLFLVLADGRVLLQPQKNEGSHSLDADIKYLDADIKFLELVVANCPKFR